VGMALVVSLCWLVFDSFFFKLLTLAAVIYVVVTVGQHGDYGVRVLQLVAISVVTLIGNSIRLSLSGYASPGLARLYLFGLSGVACWLWFQRGAPWKIWVLPIGAVVLVVWMIAVIRGPGDWSDTGVVSVEDATVDELLERDDKVLSALYEATNGRSDIHVHVDTLRELVELSDDQLSVATDRLVERSYVEWLDDVHGFVLKRKGIDSVERSRRKQERRNRMGDTFHFHGNPSGVFGSRNTVSGNLFHSSGVTEAWVSAALAAALDLRGRVGSDVAAEIQDAHDELQRAGEDGGRITRAAKKLASLAEAVGDVGVPLLRATNEILRMIPG
jgi:hypothetical protein